MRSNPSRVSVLGQDGTHPAKKDLVEELVGEEVGDTLTHTPDKVFEILNDVVVDRGPNPSMPSLLSIFLLYYI
jgi:NAD+ kinase